MAILVGLEPIISRVRRLAADTYKRALDDNCPTAFFDDDISQALQANGCEYRYQSIDGLETITPGGSVSYKIFQAPVMNWGTTTVALDGTFGTLTASSVDYYQGRWTFATAPVRPVLLLGTAYDVHGAAADLLEQYAAQNMEDFDFTRGNTKYYRAQKYDMLRRQIALLREHQRPRTVAMCRSDMDEKRNG
jgi:hypothetical protein